MNKLLILLLVLTSTIGAMPHFEIDGFGRVRSVKEKNYDFSNSAKDSNDFTSYRFQLNSKISKSKNSNTYIYLSSRFNKIAGDVSSGQSSGSLANENSINLHQVYIGHRFNDDFSMKIGRQEMNYGDQLLLGGVGWHDVGRAFDGFKFSYRNKLGTTDFFVMTIKELGAINSNYDHDLHGIYHSASFGENFDSIDLYLLFDEDIPTRSDTRALGLRAKSKIGKSLDYRTEIVFEENKFAGSEKSANMFDLELGYKLGRLRVGLEYSVASEYFNDLYPTAHKWLGYVDLFRRKNIEQKQINLSYRYSNKTSMKLAYHLFNRVKTSNTNFAWRGARPIVNTEDTLGDEVDLTIKHKLDDDLALQVGYSVFLPGSYYEESGLNSDLNWGYVQLLAKF